MKRAIFGGTFNPIHMGHLNLMLNAKKTADLDEIILMPSKIPPHKKPVDLADDEIRLHMCSLAAEPFGGISVSDYEIKQPRVSYSVYTVRHFKELYPDDELYFIMGGDMLLSFHTWYLYGEILEAVTIIAAAREEDELLKLSEYSKRSDMKKLRLVLIKEDPLVMSSTELREKLKAGGDCRNMLPQGVWEYIKENKIYEK